MRFTSFREMLAFYAGLNPHAPALFYENENRPAFFTYGQLHFLAKQQEYLYRVWGGTCLAFVPDLSRWTIGAFFGAVSAGLPVVLLDPNAPGEDLAEALPGRDFAAVLKEGRPALLIRGNPEESDELLKKTASVLKNMPRGQQLYAILFTDTPLPRTSAGKVKRKEIETMADTAGRSSS